MKKEMIIVREITILKSVDVVFNYIRLLRNQEQYSKWVMADPAMNKVFTGTDGEVGFIYAWDSSQKQVGKGAQEITAIDPGKQLECEVRFEKPMKGISKTVMSTNSNGAASTIVKWTFISNMNCPMRIFSLFVSIEKMLGKDLETSLQQLKKNLETYNN
jgi:hypothetical protein